MILDPPKPKEWGFGARNPNPENPRKKRNRKKRSKLTQPPEPSR